MVRTAYLHQPTVVAAADLSPGSYAYLSATQLGSATRRLGTYLDGSFTRWFDAASLGAAYKNYIIIKNNS